MIQSVLVSSIIVNSRKRGLNQDKVVSLAQSIDKVGLINPVTLNGNNLIAGYHRLEAVKVLGWETISAINLEGVDALQAELAEIDENLIRNELTVLQQGEWLVRRDAILEAMGQRATVSNKGGTGKYAVTGEDSSPVKTTSDIAAEVGLSERVAQQRKQIANKIAPEVKEVIYGTELEERATDLLQLSRLPVEQQLPVAERVIGGESRTVKEATKRIKRQQQIEAIETTEWPTGKYHVIVVDPPWKYESRSDDPTHRAANPYPSMSLDEIEALDIEGLALDDCILWLWTTNAFIEEAHQIVRAWGVEKKTILTWIKDKMGTGDWLRGKTEHCLMCVRGKPVVNLTNQTTVIEGPLREHSRKPDEFYTLVEELCPGTRVELFARQRRDGWEVYGNQLDTF